VSNVADIAVVYYTIGGAIPMPAFDDGLKDHHKIN
jgi:hypothetical protein